MQSENRGQSNVQIGQREIRKPRRPLHCDRTTVSWELRRAGLFGIHNGLPRIFSASRSTLKYSSCIALTAPRRTRLAFYCIRRWNRGYFIGRVYFNQVRTSFDVSCILIELDLASKSDVLSLGFIFIKFACALHRHRIFALVTKRADSIKQNALSYSDVSQFEEQTSTKHTPLRPSHPQSDLRVIVDLVRSCYRGGLFLLSILSRPCDA